MQVVLGQGWMSSDGSLTLASSLPGWLLGSWGQGSEFVSRGMIRKDWVTPAGFGLRGKGCAGRGGFGDRLTW